MNDNKKYPSMPNLKAYAVVCGPRVDLNTRMPCKADDDDLPSEESIIKSAEAALRIFPMGDPSDPRKDFAYPSLEDAERISTFVTSAEGASSGASSGDIVFAYTDVFEVEYDPRKCEIVEKSS
jgi:hypothetical protein